VTSVAAELTAYLAETRAEIDEVLDRLLPPADAPPARLHQAMRHSVFAGGKRLRPILCLAAAETLGGPREAVREPAAGLEMIHTYSLVHDDLPALDDDRLRRGQPTCHVVFGEATAILAGDALLTHGLTVLGTRPAGDAWASARGRAFEAVAVAIGTGGMIGGQVEDLEAENSHASEEQVARIHENKTGRLIRASLAVGAHLSRADAATLARLDEYGRAIGLAFQIKDDLLDVEGSAAELGKSSGKDAASGKATFPAVWGVDRSRAILRDTLAQAIEAARGLPHGGGRLPELARFVGERSR
jgi:geranylgeranyl pyrophosphate synthase